MHIVFHAHRADVTESIQQRAEQAVRKLADRLRGATDASIRFVQHGTARRVEIMLHVARRKPLVAEGEGTRYETALGTAVERLGAHVAHLRAERARNRQRVAPPNAESTPEDDDVQALLFERSATRRPAAGA